MSTTKRRTIVIVTTPGALASDVIAPGDVFLFANLIAESESSDPGYDVITASGTHDLNITTSSGVTIACKTSLYSITQEIDTLIIAGFAPGNNWRHCPELIAWLQFRSGKIRRVCSICLGAFALAEAGLLKGKRATTHWQFYNQLRKSYKGINVDPEPLFIKDGRIYTSAGISAGVDLSIALIEEDLGTEIALKTAQSILLPYRRIGNQSQFSDIQSLQSTSKEAIIELQKWLPDNLKKELTVEFLAQHIKMSPRNLARVFVKETGLTPAKYIERIRMESAKHYLQKTALSLDAIAKKCGLANVDTLRKLFIRNMNASPNNHRIQFQTINRNTKQA